MATRDEWARRVRQWRASGLTAREFAEKEGLNASTLRWWASRVEPSTGAAFVDVTALVTPPRPRSAAGFDVVVRESVRIRVEPGFDAELLRAVVAALEAR